jgi:hypothetical protein
MLWRFPAYGMFPGEDAGFLESGWDAARERGEVYFRIRSLYFGGVLCWEERVTEMLVDEPFELPVVDVNLLGLWGHTALKNRVPQTELIPIPPERISGYESIIRADLNNRYPYTVGFYRIGAKTSEGASVPAYAERDIC